MKLHKLVLVMLIITAISLAAVRVVVSNTLSTSGIALDEVNDKVAVYKLENDSLSEELLSISSLTAIASEAAKMGFSYKIDKYFLTTPSTLAKR